jgi:hypothetical protein
LKFEIRDFKVLEECYRRKFYRKCYLVTLFFIFLNFLINCCILNSFNFEIKQKRQKQIIVKL